MTHQATANRWSFFHAWCPLQCVLFFGQTDVLTCVRTDGRTDGRTNTMCKNNDHLSTLAWCINVAHSPLASFIKAFKMYEMNNLFEYLILLRSFLYF